MLDCVTISKQEWTEAEKMYLRGEAHSDAAQALLDHLLDTLPLAAPKRPSTTQRRRVALGALLASLLENHEAGKIGSHGMGRQEFPAKAFGFGPDVFYEVKDAMVAGGLLIFEPGKPRWITGGFGGGPNDITNAGGWVARFKLTDEAIAVATRSGVTDGSWGDHWQLRTATAKTTGETNIPAPALIGLRASNTWAKGNKRQGDELPVDLSHPSVSTFLADLEAHNAFVLSAGVTGTDFLGLRRLFNDGDRPARLWRSGGRFYSVRMPGMSKPYEAMPGAKRRRTLRIGGQRVGEVDMSASQLRILSALMGYPMAEGIAAAPYDLKGFNRDGIKTAIAQALGKGTVESKTWGKEADKVVKALDFAAHNEAAVEAHPVLRRLGEPHVPDALGLQFHESEIMRLAMAQLRSQSIASLPVHDSLIVPVGNIEDAGEALRSSFRSYVEGLNGYTTNHVMRVAVKV